MIVCSSIMLHVGAFDAVHAQRNSAPPPALLTPSFDDSSPWRWRTSLVIFLPGGGGGGSKGGGGTKAGTYPRQVPQAETLPTAAVQGLWGHAGVHVAICDS